MKKRKVVELISHEERVSWKGNYQTTQNLGCRHSLMDQFLNVEEGKFGIDFVENLSHSDTVLDAGCGTGKHLLALANKFPQASYFAIDYSQAMVDLVSEKLPSVSAVPGTVESLPWQDRSFSLVVCMHVLYHVHDISKAISELARVVSEGGKVIVTTVSPKSSSELVEFHNAACGSLNLEEFSVREMPSARFNTENGQAQLEQSFGDVSFFPRQAHFAFPSAEDAYSYYLSLASFQAAESQSAEISLKIREAVFALMKERVESHGSVQVTKDTGTWIAIS